MAAPTAPTRPSATTVRALWAAILSVALAGLVAAAIKGPAETDLRAAGQGAATTTVPGSVVAGPTGGDGAGGVGGEASAGTTATTEAAQVTSPPSTAAGAPATTTVPVPTTAAPADLGPPQDPGPTVPPRPGTYTYDVSSGGEARQATWLWEQTETAGDDRGYRVTVRGAASGQGPSGDVTNRVLWKPSRVTVQSTSFTFGQQKGDCDWEPDSIQLVLPLAKGLSWSSDASCTVMFGTTSVKVTRSVRSTVDGLTRTKVGSTVVDGWTITGTETVTYTSAGFNGKADQASTTVFSPRHGIVVRQSTTTTSGDGQKATVEIAVRNLDPT